ncbi:MAG TPA: formyltransferase family protein [Gammaproteobacteria bacterium]
MTTPAASPKPPQQRVLFFGTPDIFSNAVLGPLLTRGVNIVGVVMPGVQPNLELQNIGGIPIVQNPNHSTIEKLALEHHIPLNYVQDLASSKFQNEIAQFKADYILVACFPYKLPHTLCQAARIAALNLHPSLLPAYRGPYPVFWQLRNGEIKTGVTLHLLSDEIDAGDIILQTEVPLRAGLRGRAIETRLGEFGAKLFLEALRLYQLNNVNAQPQSWIQASYMPAPKYDDFEICPTWPARRAFGFIRGTEEWNRAYQIKINGKTVYIKTAMAYSPSGKIDNPYALDDNYITMQFSPGLVNAYIESIS